MIAISHHVIKTIHINPTSTNKLQPTQWKPRIGHDLEQKFAARRADPGECGTSLVFGSENNITDELDALNMKSVLSNSRSRPCHTPKSPWIGPIFELHFEKSTHSLVRARAEARFCNTVHSADTYGKALHVPNRGQDHQYTLLASLAP